MKQRTSLSQFGKREIELLLERYCLFRSASWTSANCWHGIFQLAYAYKVQIPGELDPEWPK